MLNIRRMQFIAEKIFSINPARTIVDGNTLKAGAIKIIFIDENHLIMKIDNVSINITI